MVTETVYRIHTSKYYSDEVVKNMNEIDNFFREKREYYKKRLDKWLISLKNYNYWNKLLDNAVITREKIESEILTYNTKQND